MDLHSLPDEMLASVFKYSKYQTLSKIRKINQHIDRVTVRHGVNKPKIYYVEIHGRIEELTFYYRKNDIYEQAKETPHDYGSWSVDIHRENGNLVEILQEYMKKVRCKTIVISCYEIDENWMKMLKNYENPNKYTVRLDKCNIKISCNDLKPIMENFNSAQIYVTYWNTTLDGTCETDEGTSSVLSIANFLRFGSHGSSVGYCPLITDKTLQRACKSMPTCFDLNERQCSFSITEVLKTLNTFIEYVTLEETSHYWDFGYIQLNSKDVLQRRLMELKELKGNSRLRVFKDQSPLVSTANIVLFKNISASSGQKSYFVFKLNLREY